MRIVAAEAAGIYLEPGAGLGPPVCRFEARGGRVEEIALRVRYHRHPSGVEYRLDRFERLAAQREPELYQQVPFAAESQPLQRERAARRSGVRGQDLLSERHQRQ